MYLLGDQFLGAVSFLEGFNAAFDGRPLRGFRDWVSLRVLGRRSNLHWAYVIASVRFPEVAEEGGIGEIPKEGDVKLVEDLIDLLEGFIEEHSDVRRD
ncbi:hypothetical protein [Streptomyces sp. NPDC049879]|uniref:hypothetical protein n=1 Tax=Streptomyces sp. NPDC049879 TaxID=3365598 RepID=UPI0037997F2F